MSLGGTYPRPPSTRRGNDGEGGRGGHGSQEIAAVQIAHYCLRNRMYGRMLPKDGAKRNGDVWPRMGARESHPEMVKPLVPRPSSRVAVSTAYSPRNCKASPR
jgi:ribosomal protein L15